MMKLTEQQLRTIVEFVMAKDVNELVNCDMVVPHFQASSRKQVFQKLSELISVKHGMRMHDIFHEFNQRQKLGGTGIGNNSAIPTVTIADYEGEPYGVFIRLQEPVEYDGEDAVDLVFALVFGSDSGRAVKMGTMHRVMKFLQDGETRQKLRKAVNRDEICRILAV